MMIKDAIRLNSHLMEIHQTMLDSIAIFLLVVGLAMDSISVAVAVGLKLGDRLLQASRLSMAFGSSHIAMPMIGWWLGISIIDLISAHDHWVAISHLRRPSQAGGSVGVWGGGLGSSAPSSLSV